MTTRQLWKARSRWLSALAVMALVLAACGGGDEDADVGAGGAAPSTEPAGEVTVTHAQGQTTVDVNPETVVVFDLGVLVTLDDLGVQVDGVPQVTTLPASMAKYGGDAYKKVGTLFEPNYEEVNAMAPDLIIVGGRSSAVYPELAKIAPTVDLTVDSAHFMDSFRQRTEALGTIFGREEQVKTRLANLDSAVKAAKGKAPEAGKGLIVLVTGGKVSAFGPGSRFGMIHDVLGVAPAIEDVEAATHGDVISFELILQSNPDVLYVIDRDSATGQAGEAARRVLDNELVRRTAAWQSNSVVYLDPFAWYLAPNGLRSVEGMVAEVATSLG